MTFQFNGTVDKTQKFVLTYVELDKNISAGIISRYQKLLFKR